jgi:hypothetical protein
LVRGNYRSAWNRLTFCGRIAHPVPNDITNSGGYAVATHHDPQYLQSCVSLDLVTQYPSGALFRVAEFTMTIVLTQLSRSATFDDLFRAPPLHLTTDWFGHPFAPPLDIFLGMSGERILFGAQGAGTPQCAPATPGDFIEGLWERDVVELFLGESDSPRYQEFNLSPRGAWWTMAFTGYRTRMATTPLPGLRCDAAKTPSGWRAATAIPINELSIRWASARGTVNVTAICGTPQRFVTALNLGGGEPDFHRAEHFRPPRVETLCP